MKRNDVCSRARSGRYGQPDKRVRLRRRKESGAPAYPARARGGRVLAWLPSPLPRRSPRSCSSPPRRRSPRRPRTRRTCFDLAPRGGPQGRRRDPVRRDRPSPRSTTSGSPSRRPDRHVQVRIVRPAGATGHAAGHPLHPRRRLGVRQRPHPRPAGARARRRRRRRRRLPRVQTSRPRPATRSRSSRTTPSRSGSPREGAVQGPRRRRAWRSPATRSAATWPRR